MVKSLLVEIVERLSRKAAIILGFIIIAPQKENASPKKKRTKTTEIQLENPPQDEV